MESVPLSDLELVAKELTDWALNVPASTVYYNDMALLSVNHPMLGQVSCDRDQLWISTHGLWITLAKGWSILFSWEKKMKDHAKWEADRRNEGSLRRVASLLRGEH